MRSCIVMAKRTKGRRLDNTHVKRFSHPENGDSIFFRNVGIPNHYAVQKFKRRPRWSSLEQFMTFARIKPSGLLRIGQRWSEGHMTLNIHTKKGNLSTVIATSHGTSSHEKHLHKHPYKYKI
jgi:hypothetical protein